MALNPKRHSSERWNPVRKPMRSILIKALVPGNYLDSSFRWNDVFGIAPHESLVTQLLVVAPASCAGGHETHTMLAKQRGLFQRGALR